jgi:hypothetical protein
MTKWEVVKESSTGIPIIKPYGSGGPLLVLSGSPEDNRDRIRQLGIMAEYLVKGDPKNFQGFDLSGVNDLELHSYKKEWF